MELNEYILPKNGTVENDRQMKQFTRTGSNLGSMSFDDNRKKTISNTFKVLNSEKIENSSWKERLRRRYIIEIV